MNAKYFLVGGAGFIGSHFTDYLLSQPATMAVRLFDNFSSGREWHYQEHLPNSKFSVERGDVKDLSALTKAMAGYDVVIHLAANPDIAKAATDPDIDFREGTLLTRHVLEAMRITQAKQLLYTSGSGVYGDWGDLELSEDHGPLIPVSTYGASKLSSEAQIASYCYMFGLSACAFRFANVVGPRQTHGVGFDFLRKLKENPQELTILGNGTQRKSYIYVNDVIAAVMTALQKKSKPFSVYNVSTPDAITVEQIAHLAVEILDLNTHEVKSKFTGGDRGWKGDVPVIRLNSERIRSLGWSCQRNSSQAVRDAMLAMLQDFHKGRM